MLTGDGKEALECCTPLPGLREVIDDNGICHSLPALRDIAVAHSRLHGEGIAQEREADNSSDEVKAARSAGL